eukprot:CAMPEP_0116830922 /NCGR_PEP_ID=MMETSP0418-20121206/5041_1 /TAXON_ID=1158023 /ORGANISM="Astrosyne radiata, Strain 13vi08-1A" /LENGTH=169 /DNA_ID=CAMNT_0004460097 /DNA_START=484 /DNA_END=993 /DNA_ORIENTATION=+
MEPPPTPNNPAKKPDPSPITEEATSFGVRCGSSSVCSSPLGNAWIMYDLAGTNGAMQSIKTPNAFLKADPDNRVVTIAPVRAVIIPQTVMAAAASSCTSPEYPIAPATPVAATAKRDVPCAWCWLVLRNFVINGTITKPPPIPARDPKTPPTDPTTNAVGTDDLFPPFE